MDKKHQDELLAIARDAVQAAVQGQSMAIPEVEEPDLNAQCGCFVTLKQGEQLRGCIGRFVSDRPLVESVVEMGRAAACEDPRFVNHRLVPGELPQLHLEISVLSPLQRTDNPLSLRLGVDGIYIKRGPVSGCFLPQVATETGWSKEEFLSICCAHKAGLAAEAWQDPQTEVYLFTAEVFGALFQNIHSGD